MMLQDRPEIFWGVIASMYLGNIFLLVLNLPLIPLLARILDLPRPLLLSCIILFCLIGVYAVKFSAFDLYVLLVFGGIGLAMRLNGFPLAPMILALILGALLEENMRRALQISGGDWTTFLTKPIAASLLAIAIVSLAAPPLVRLWQWQRSR
jgi:putative tricarboxylic transport membrane protein